MNSIVVSVCALVISYIIGSIPTGFLIARLFGVKDIRQHGSGNIGATNVARVLGKKFFPPIFLLDATKAFLTLYFLSYYGFSEVQLLLCAVVHLIGNGRSFFLQGTGGKGVATSVGLLVALQPCVVPLLFVIWSITFMFTSIVGIASMFAALLIPICTWFCGYPVSFFIFSCFITVWILVRHKKNIQELRIL